MNLAPNFNPQFFDDDGTPLSGGLLYTYASGTVTPQTTYQDQAGVTANANPIVLNARGECTGLWLTSGVEYTFLLKRADLTTVWTRDDIGGAASTSGTVASVNGLTGVVALTADDIPFTTGTSTTWFVGTDVGAAIDAVITRADSPPAAAVTIADAGGYFTGSTVEAALQELGASEIPAQTGNSGKFLSTNGTALSWAVAGVGTSTQSANGTATLPSGLILKWGTTTTFALDTGGYSVSFPTAFPTACFMVIGSASTNNSVSPSNANYSVGIHSWTTSGFGVENDSYATTVTWLAIGN